MKIILALLISCASLLAQTTYPVLSTTSNRTVDGGLTNLAVLNSNNVFTGTMRATAAVTFTNASNVFAGDGSGLTGLLGTNSPYLNGTNTWTGANTFANAVTVAQGQTLYVKNDNNSTTVGSIFGTSGSLAVYGSANGLNLLSAGRLALDCTYLSFGAGYDIELYRDAADVLAQRRSANAQTFRVYGIYSSASDYVRASLSATTNSILLSAETAGTGEDNVSLQLIPAGTAGVIIGSGGAGITKVLSATATLNFDLTALTVEDLTITVTGAATGDVVTLGVPNGSVTTSVQYSAWVSAADTVTVRARTSAAGENPASGTFRATIFKH